MILGDYHTHTKNSDGKGLLEDTLIAADKIGLREVGISDHGLGHLCRGMHFRDIERMRTDMDKLQSKFKVKCLLSVEANIYASDGSVDLTEQQRDMFDYIIAGYHKAAKPQSVKDYFSFSLPAFFADSTRYTDAKRRKYTKTVVAAIKSGRINILSHPNYGIPTFIKEIGKAALDYDVYIELNGKKVSMTDDEILLLADMGVKFIVNSDAHTPDRIGEVSVPMAVVDRLKIDKKSIVNWERLPELSLKHLKAPK